MKCEPIHFLCNIEFFFDCSKEKNAPNRKHKRRKEQKKLTNEEIFWKKKPSFKTTRII